MCTGDGTLNRHRTRVPSSAPPLRSVLVSTNSLAPAAATLWTTALCFFPPLERSMELLQLRRDRVVRADSIIDKNQALILSAPNLLPRLMELLRVMNFNPSLALFGATSERGAAGRGGSVVLLRRHVGGKAVHVVLPYLC